MFEAFKKHREVELDLPYLIDTETEAWRTVSIKFQTTLGRVTAPRVISTFDEKSTFYPKL